MQYLGSFGVINLSSQTFNQSVNHLAYVPALRNVEQRITAANFLLSEIPTACSSWTTSQSASNQLTSERHFLRQSKKRFPSTVKLKKKFYLNLMIQFKNKTQRDNFILLAIMSLLQEGSGVVSLLTVTGSSWLTRKPIRRRSDLPSHSVHIVHSVQFIRMQAGVRRDSRLHANWRENKWRVMPVTLTSNNILTIWSLSLNLTALTLIPSPEYASISLRNTCLLKNICNCSLAALMHNCSKLLYWKFSKP